MKSTKKKRPKQWVLTIGGQPNNDAKNEDWSEDWSEVRCWLCGWYADIYGYFFVSSNGHRAICGRCVKHPKEIPARVLKHAASLQAEAAVVSDKAWGRRCRKHADELKKISKCKFVINDLSPPEQ
jgi:hypothetical protein